MIKNDRMYEFTKLPSSEVEANSGMFKENEEKYNLFENKLFIIFAIIFIIIFILWVLAELLFEYNIVSQQSKLSIIINTFDKKHNLTYLLRTLMDQSISYYEIIITKNFESNYSSLAFDKFKKKNVKIKIIQYNENDTNLKIRIDSVTRARGDYILFMNPEDYFSEDCLGKYLKLAIKNNYDITSYDSFHDKYEVNTIISQPQLFERMLFDKDIIQQSEFHLSGKIIKKEIFLESVKDIDEFYLENNNKYFEQSMLVFKVYKKAYNFMKVKGREANQTCNKSFCPKKLIYKDGYSRNELRDIIIYLKFLIQYTDNKVLEKRMAIKLFIEILVKKEKTKQNFRQNEDLIEFLDEVISLYSQCDIINEYDKKLIKDFRDDIKLKSKQK
jgi:hypothetical protein